MDRGAKLPKVSLFAPTLSTVNSVTKRQFLFLICTQLFSLVDCSVIYVMDEGNKCASLRRSDCTLETLLSENNNYSATFPSSPSIKTPEIDLAGSSDAL